MTKEFGYCPAKSEMYYNAYINFLNEKITDNEERNQLAKNMPEFQSMKTLDIQKWLQKETKEKRLPPSASEINQVVLDTLFKKRNTTITSTTSTTFTTRINSWGHLDKENKIIIEQIDDNTWIYNIAGFRGVAKLQSKKLGRKVIYFIECRGEIFEFNKKPDKPIYLVPRDKEVYDYVSGKYKVLPFATLFQKIKKALSTLYDFKFKEDINTTVLYICQTWLLPILEGCFFLGIDATKGGGKTTLLEIITTLSRHGFIADVSPAAIPRLKILFDLSLNIDEIDQLQPQYKEVIEGLMRKSQRRGQSYVRLNKNTHVPEIYPAFGNYAYSYRGEVEDAFKQRSLKIHTAETKNKQLPILNYYQKLLLTELYEDIFFWFIEHICYLSSKSSKVVDVVGLFTRDVSIDDLRLNIFNDIMKDFSKDELKIFEKLYGRNVEVTFIVLQICKILKLDLSADIKAIMEQKQEDENIPDNYYIERLSELIKTKINFFKEQNNQWQLKKGEFANYHYYPKTSLYREFVNILKQENIFTIGTPTYNRLLRDLGFVENYNLLNQRHYTDKTPVKCCIFDKDVLKKIGYVDQIEATIEETIFNPHAEVLTYIKDNPKQNAIHLDENYTLVIKELIEQGEIFENPKGTYKLM